MAEQESQTPTGTDPSSEPPPQPRPDPCADCPDPELPHGHHGHEELPIRESDPVLRVLHYIMRFAAYLLAIAMVIVIIEGVISVIHTLYTRLSSPPYFMIPDIVQTFAAFLAVLIAYEIFANITLYIRSDVFPMKLVVATALMAIARKVIVLDMAENSALDLFGLGALVVGLGLAYWLIARADGGARPPPRASTTGGKDV
jgi:uncharacterized membrane protein (DUF373 family)